jgi:hypothetical protein
MVFMEYPPTALWVAFNRSPDLYTYFVPNGGIDQLGKFLAVISTGFVSGRCSSEHQQ